MVSNGPAGGARPERGPAIAGTAAAARSAGQPGGPALVVLSRGDPAPDFTLPTATQPHFALGSAAGRWIVLFFWGAGNVPGVGAALAQVASAGQLFDDRHAAFFGVAANSAELAPGGLAATFPGLRHFDDSERIAARAYGAAPRGGGPNSQPDSHPLWRPLWAVLAPDLRVHAILPATGPDAGAAAALALVAALPAPERHAGVELPVPVLMVPDTFEPDLCARLIAACDAAGPQPSGFMRQVDGRTVLVEDRNHKSRSDHVLEDQALIAAARGRIVARVVPAIARAFQFRATRMERHIVGRYAAEEGGHFRAHRDNTTAGTAHRRFAVSVNLNDGFEGGELNFPEFGPRRFCPPPGAAIVFSCSLLHAVSPVRAGVRYAFLPFLYDEASARLRARNAHLVDGQDAPGALPSGAPPRP